jgi:hypothetical protein
MAGSAPEGSQFDARQYDAKMDSMYVKLSPVPPACPLKWPTLKT